MKSIFMALFLVAVVSAEPDNINFIQRHKRAAVDQAVDQAVDDNCFANIAGCCQKQGDFCIKNCTSLILDSAKPYDDFVKYSNDYLIRSYEYLFLSAQFGTFSKDRPGFEKILHGLSDAAWSKGLEMIKESAKRGVAHSFKNTNDVAIKAHGEVGEVEALAKAVEIEKTLLKRAMDVHRHHSHATLKDDKATSYDVGFSHYLEEEIIEDKTQTLRNLVGHVNDLKNLFKNNANLFPMSLYLFDQQLQK